MIDHVDLSQRILDAALDMAQHSSWEQLRLHDVATELKVGLDDIRKCYPQKDDLVEAWYDRADSAMLQVAQVEAFSGLEVQERLETLIMAWLDKLAEHKTVSRDMLLYKLEPGHIHLQLAGILRISRTVQWIREAALLDQTHLKRILEEIGLTTIYIATFVHWMGDSSEHQSNTRTFLQKKLEKADKLAKTLF